MQTIAFIKLLQEMIKKLRANELIEVLQTLLDSSQNQQFTEEYRTKFAELVFEAREGLAGCTSSPESKAISDSLGIHRIYQPRQLSLILTIMNSQDNSSGIHNVPDNFALFNALLSNLKILVAFSQTLEHHLWKQRIALIGENERILEIEISDLENGTLTLGRLASILESLHRLHTYIAKVMEDKSAKLTICYLDSGSDYIIGLQSSFKVVEIMRTLMQQFWQRVRFKTIEEIEKGIEQWSKNLNIVQHISRQEKNGVFDSDSAAKLRNTILDEMANLVANGVLLKEYETEEKFERKKILLEKKELKLQLTK